MLLRETITDALMQRVFFNEPEMKENLDKRSLEDLIILAEDKGFEINASLKATAKMLVTDFNNQMPSLLICKFFDNDDHIGFEKESDYAGVPVTYGIIVAKDKDGKSEIIWYGSLATGEFSACDTLMSYFREQCPHEDVVTIKNKISDALSNEKEVCFYGNLMF